MRGGYSLLREHAESALKLQRRTSESCVSWGRYPRQRVALSRVRGRHRMLVDSAGTYVREGRAIWGPLRAAWRPEPK